MAGHFYVTSFCNFAHDTKTGRPIGHECYIIPPSALKLEMAGDTDGASEIMQTKMKRVFVRGRERKNPASGASQVVWDVDPTSGACAVTVSAFFQSHAAARKAASDLGSLEGEGFEVADNFAYCMIGPSWQECVDGGMSVRSTDKARANIFKAVCREIESAGHDWREV